MKITVIGSGAWGTTLANLMAENGHLVSVWTHSEQFKKEIEKYLKSPFLPKGVKVHASILWETDVEKSCEDSEFVFLVVASQFVRSMTSQINAFLKEDQNLILATKGIDEESLESMFDIVKKNLRVKLQKNIYVLSGPNIAKEIAKQKPAATVIAGDSTEVIKKVQQVLSTKFFRVYGSKDPVGVHLGGSLKNVIAIAAGIVDGFEMGENAKAGLMVRGMAEMIRLATKMEAKVETLYGLAGMGDLITTCNSRQSRNHFVGEQLSKGLKLEDILKKMTEVAEGVTTAKSLYALSKKYQIEMPITEQVYQVLYEGKTPLQACEELMTRKLSFENGQS